MDILVVIGWNYSYVIDFIFKSRNGLRLTFRSLMLINFVLGFNIFIFEG